MQSDIAPVALPGLTDQQRRALGARGTSVALSAGAGCGKTFVLTERFLAELAPNAGAARPRLGQLIAITFTERAAREMRDRIRRACRRRLLDCPEDQADYWLELLRDLDAARISTIHAFGASLLRANAVEAGVDPRFRVLDAAQAATLRYELVDQLLRARLADRDEAALGLVARFGLDRLRDMISGLLDRRQEIDWSAWRGETPEALAARWEAFWRDDALPRILNGIERSAAARTVRDVSLRCPPAAPKMRERCDTLIRLLENLSSSGRPADDLTAIRDAARVQGGATKTTWGDPDAFERFRDAAKALREAIDRVLDQLRFDAAAAMPAARMALDALRLADLLAAEYESKKRELRAMDFDDLLIRARDLLVDPRQGDLRRRLASQLRLLLVDEFQDTDPLQVELIKAICDNEHLRGKLFFVGDFKQSIYRFRGAQPHVFRLLREEVPESGRLPLSLNFRSQPAVLEFVNALFAEEFGPDYEPLEAHRPQIGPRPAVEFLWACGDEISEDSERENREQMRRREADWIARRIRAMLDSGEKIVWDKDAEKAGVPAVRAARPGDVAVLFRALTDVEYYEEALRRRGIDYYLVGGHAFYAQQEIHDVLNLLRSIDNPSDEVSLTGALRSPMFGLHDESLLWLAQEKGLSRGLFEAEPPRELNDVQRQRVRRAAAVLGCRRAVKDRLPVARLIQAALDQTGYDAVLLAEFLGPRKLANLHKLVEQARGFDETGVLGLSDFVVRLSEFVARRPDEALAATCPESTDAVKLMTIHQSKGLEFPVVVVADVSRPRRPSYPSAAFTPRLGPMLKDPDAVGGYDLYQAAENDADLEEHARLLYVAATRAADYMILSAGLEEPGKFTGPWMELLGREFDLQRGERREERGKGEKASGGMSGSLPIESPRLVKVISSEPIIESKPVDLRPRRDLDQIVEKAWKMADQGQGRTPRYVGPFVGRGNPRRGFSFSRLSGKLRARTADVVHFAWDEASDSPALDPCGLGTLVHAVLAELDFARPGDVNALVRRRAESQLLEDDAMCVEAVELVERFLATPRAAELASAVRVHRELEFMLAWPLECREPTGCHLQGIIDCLYLDASGRWRLIDYKTNRAATEDYEMQMLVYALAVEQIQKIAPAELAICFLRLGSERSVAWDDAARRRVVAWVDRAIAE